MCKCGESGKSAGRGRREISNAVRREHSCEGTDVRCSQPCRGSVDLESSNGGRNGDCRRAERCKNDRLLLHGGVFEGRVLVHRRVGAHRVVLGGVGVGVAKDARAGAVPERAIDADADEEGRGWVL